MSLEQPTSPVTWFRTYSVLEFRQFLKTHLWPGAQPRLKSWGEQRFGSQHRNACAPRPAKGRTGCWVREGVVPSLWGSGVLPPENFLKTQMLNPAFWWLLAVKFLAFWKLPPRSWGKNTLLAPNRPYGCCAYACGWVPWRNVTITLINLYLH